jgi:outer membrane protein
MTSPKKTNILPDGGKEEMLMFTQKKTCFAVVLMSLVIMLASGAEAAPDASTIGVVDYFYLINNHPDTPKANEALKAEQEAVKKEFADKSAGLSDADKQSLDRQLVQRVEQKRLELLKLITDSINAAMKAVAEAKGLDTVLFKNTVALGGQDITEEVLKKITGK